MIKFKLAILIVHIDDVIFWEEFLWKIIMTLIL